MDGDGRLLEFSGFNSLYKTVLKHYRHSFSNDYNNVLKVIKTGTKVRGGIENIPQTKRISGLGKDVDIPVYKTRIYINQSKKHDGRIVYIYDAERNTFFLIEVYTKKSQNNHNTARIITAFNEYKKIIEEEKLKSDGST